MKNKVCFHTNLTIFSDYLKIYPEKNMKPPRKRKKQQLNLKSTNVRSKNLQNYCVRSKDKLKSKKKKGASVDLRRSKKHHLKEVHRK